jgi:hypothetical protein
LLDKQRVGDLIGTTIPGGTLLAALIFAPWFWGCTWPLGVHLLTILLLGAIGSWALGLLWRRGKSGLPPLLLITVVGLMAQGWAMTLNARSVCDDASGLLFPLPGHVAWLPGSVDQPRSQEDMARLSALLSAGVISTWLGQARAWRTRLLWTLSATGLSIVLLGCWQRWTRATDIFWNASRHLDFFFATYRDVTNAGEYFNLILPVTAALTLVAVVKRQGPVRVAFGAMATVLLVLGSMVCGSKMAPIITLLSAAFFVAMQGKVLRDYAGRTRVRIGLVTALIVVVTLAVLVQSAGPGITWARWDRFLHETGGGATLANRLLVDRVCVLAAPDAGLFGFGPGTFRPIFPYYSGRVEGDLTGVWTYAHDDYAQTLVEWGFVGAALWSLYFFGGIVALARGWWRGGWWRGGWRTEDRIVAAGLLQALVVVALMATVDFPLQIASIQLCAGVLLGLAWSSLRWPRSANEARRHEGNGGEVGKSCRPNFLA